MAPPPRRRPQKRAGRRDAGDRTGVLRLRAQVWAWVAESSAAGFRLVQNCPHQVQSKQDLGRWGQSTQDLHVESFNILRGSRAHEDGQPGLFCSATYSSAPSDGPLCLMGITPPWEATCMYPCPLVSCLPLGLFCSGHTALPTCQQAEGPCSHLRDGCSLPARPFFWLLLTLLTAFSNVRLCPLFPRTHTSQLASLECLLRAKYWST